MSGTRSICRSNVIIIVIRVPLLSVNSLIGCFFSKKKLARKEKGERCREGDEGVGASVPRRSSCHGRHRLRRRRLHANNAFE